MCRGGVVHHIVMTFLTPVLGCLLKKGLQYRGVTGIPGPYSYALACANQPEFILFSVFM